MNVDVDGLRFTFAPEWRVEKWDETDAYRSGIHRQGETKAVDLLARSASGLAIIEVKDFRKDPATDWRRVKDKSLAVEVAAKVRDTLAGLLGAARSEGPAWDEWVDAIRRTETLHVVVWLERPDSYHADARCKSELQHFRQQLKSRLSWLTSNIFIASRHERVRLPGIEAVDVPVARTEGPLRAAGRSVRKRQGIVP